MKNQARSKVPVWTTLGLALPLAGLLAFGSAASTAPSASGAEPAQAQKQNRYIGASKCKSCHSSEETGDQHGEWAESEHAEAFAALASPEAKKVASEKGIADPQKAPECVKCHVTGHGQPEAMFKKGFEIDAGVQCESCHGPGEQHVAARMAAAMGGGEDEGFGDEAKAYTPPPAGEIVTSPEEATCRACHNRSSPTFKPFCFYERIEQVEHHNPKKPRDAAKELVCGCGDPCPCTESCAEHECAKPRGEAEGSPSGDKK